MANQEKIEWALYQELFVRQGIVKTFEEALRHSSGEPVRVYGADIPHMAKRISWALAGGRDG